MVSSFSNPITIMSNSRPSKTYSRELLVDFNITIPDSLGSACNTGGKCALQWFWWSKSNSQTYESCVDFYVKG